MPSVEAARRSDAFSTPVPLFTSTFVSRKFACVPMPPFVRPVPAVIVMFTPVTSVPSSAATACVPVPETNSGESVFSVRTVALSELTVPTRKPSTKIFWPTANPAVVHERRSA